MKSKYTIYIYLAFIAILAILSIFIIKPYIAAIVLGAIFAYWFYPLYKKLASRLNNTASALIITITFSVILALIVQSAIYLIVKETVRMSSALNSIGVGDMISAFLGGELFSGVTMHAIFDQVLTSMMDRFSAIIYSMPEIIVGFASFILCFYYFLKDGEKMISWLKRNIPFPIERRKKLIDKAKGYIDAFLRAQLIISAAQGIICALGFYIFGLREYILLGSLAAALLSLLPIVGSSLIYIPVGAMLAVTGSTGNGIGLIIYGLLISSILDHIVRPSLTAKYAEIHPLIAFGGALGGLAVFGLAGLFIGPIILILLLLVLETIGEGKFIPGEEEE